MLKRIAAFVLALSLLVLSGLFSACAAGEDGWTCPSCSHAGNTGNFCPVCGTQKPDESWTCASCGQAGNTGNFCTNCGAPCPSGNAPAAVDETLEKIPGETGCVKIRLSSVSATRYIVVSQDPSKWAPENAADGDEETCWQFDSKGKKQLSDSKLTLTFVKAHPVDSVWFKNGFWDSTGEKYVRNSRPKEITLEFLYQGAADFTDAVRATLADDTALSGWQVLDVGRHENVTAVRVSVLSYYSGTKYPNDVCLAEVMAVQNAPAAGAADPGPSGSAFSGTAQPLTGTAELTTTIATRAGPSTEYEGTGSFWLNDNWKGVTVNALSRACVSGVWWVEVDFTYVNGTRYRVFTGAKRLKVNLDPLPERKVIGLAGFLWPTEAYYGPGYDYAKSKEDVLFFEEQIDIIDRENGFVQVDFYDVNREFQRRIWVPESAVTDVIWY